MRIRRERPGDAASIAVVHGKAFGSPTEASLVARIRATPRYRPEWSLVAEEDGHVVGHVLLSDVDLIGQDTWSVPALAPMAVLPDRQRHGIGSALVRASLAAAVVSSQPLITVLGHSRFYPRFGFVPAAPLGIRCPFDVADDVWMVRLLPGYTPALRGTIRYPPAFEGL